MIFTKIDNYEIIWIFSIIWHPPPHLLTFLRDVFWMKYSRKILVNRNKWWGGGREPDGGLSLKIDIIYISVAILVRILKVKPSLFV